VVLQADLEFETECLQSILCPRSLVSDGSGMGRTGLNADPTSGLISALFLSQFM
jgi:hypothetical protein